MMNLAPSPRHILPESPVVIVIAGAVGLINRCDEAQTYDARLAAGTLPRSNAKTLSVDGDEST